jgi:thiazole/oxazole-forming peptide maturase SagD family component
LTHSINGPLHHLPVPAPGCPIRVVATRVRPAREGTGRARFVSGWGASIEEASIGCRREAAERYAAQFAGDEPVERGDIRGFAGAAIAPPNILLISDQQFARRRHWNLAYPGFNELPEPWDDRRPIDWIATDAGLSSALRMLPAGLCLLGHDRDLNAGLAPADSNGVAAGSSPLDAAVRAFIELVERDAVAIWWYNRLSRPLVDLKDLAVPLVNAYADWSARRGRAFRLHDISHDLGIPVFAAVTHNRDGGRIALGFGAGLPAGEAARHAVGELAQFETNVALMESSLAATGKSPPTAEAKALLAWWATGRLAEHPHLEGKGVAAMPAGQRLLDLKGCQVLCRNIGLDLLALNLTRRDGGMPVARVIVPGLRPMWARFAAGRLYDVPVRLGWRTLASPEAQLNPTPLMF